MSNVITVRVLVDNPARIRNGLAPIPGGAADVEIPANTPLLTVEAAQYLSETYDSQTGKCLMDRGKDYHGTYLCPDAVVVPSPETVTAGAKSMVTRRNKVDSDLTAKANTYRHYLHRVYQHRKTAEREARLTMAWSNQYQAYILNRKDASLFECVADDPMNHGTPHRASIDYMVLYPAHQHECGTTGVREEWEALPEVQAWMRDLAVLNEQRYAQAVYDCKKLVDVSREQEKAKQLAQQAYREQRDAWVMDHGSEHLRACLWEGIPMDRLYKNERMAADRPGWQWCEQVAGSAKEPRNPPSEAMAKLMEARKVDPACKLVFVPEADDYGVLGEFLGEKIVTAWPDPSDGMDE